MRFTAQTFGDDPGLEKNAREESTGGCRVALVQVSRESLAASGLVERNGGLFEELGSSCPHQIEKLWAGVQTSVRVTATADGLLKRGDLSVELQGFARGRISLDEDAGAVRAAAA